MFNKTLSIILDWIKNINALLAVGQWPSTLFCFFNENLLIPIIFIIAWTILKYLKIVISKIWKKNVKDDHDSIKVNILVSLEKALGIWVNSRLPYYSRDMTDKWSESLWDCNTDDILPYKIFTFMTFVKEDRVTLYAHELLSTDKIELNPIDNFEYSEFNLFSQSRWKDNYNKLYDNDYKLRFLNVSVKVEDLNSLIKHIKNYSFKKP